MWEGREGGRRVVLVSRDTENLNTKRKRGKWRYIIVPMQHTGIYPFTKTQIGTDTGFIQNVQETHTVNKET